MKKFKRKPTLFDYIKALLSDILFHTYSILVLYLLFYKKIFLDEYTENFDWKILYICLAISTLISFSLFWISGFSLGKRITGLQTSQIDKSFYKKPYIIFSIYLFSITVFSGFYISQFSLQEFLSEGGIAGAKRIFLALLSPNFSIFEDVLYSAIETIFLAFTATLISIPISFLICFLAAKNLMQSKVYHRFIYFIVRVVLNFTRSIEPLIWAIIFSVWVGIGPFAGMLALMIHSVASLTKLYSEQIESVNNGPIEAMKATGANSILVIWYGVVPQIVIPFISYTIYRWDINVRMATIIGLVGGGGIGTLLMQYQGLAKWHEVGLIVFVIAFIVWMMDYASAKIRESIK